MTNRDKIDILYICDKKKCESCSDICKYTSDIDHAVHKDTLNCRLFECINTGERIGFFEKDIHEKKKEWDTDVIFINGEEER